MLTMCNLGGDCQNAKNRWGRTCFGVVRTSFPKCKKKKRKNNTDKENEVLGSESKQFKKKKKKKKQKSEIATAEA